MSTQKQINIAAKALESKDPTIRNPAQNAWITRCLKTWANLSEEVKTLTRKYAVMQNRINEIPNDEKTILEQLMEKLTEKGIQFETNEAKTKLGIKFNGQFVWHWFDVLHGKDIMFNHSYSQNTGETKKGIMRGIKVYARIEKLTQIKL